MVSIHAPVKGATLLTHDTHDPYLVSIHAPVKGATAAQYRSAQSLLVSIHAPVKGATRSLLGMIPRATFQSTPP